MAKSILLDESVESQVATEVTETPAVRLRPVVDLPAQIRIFGTTFWPESETKQAQYSGYSHELGCFGRVYGEPAKALFGMYGANKVSGEETGKSVSLLIHTHPGSNGLFFGAENDDQRDYVSLNEYAIAQVELWAPKMVLVPPKQS